MLSNDISRKGSKFACSAIYNIIFRSTINDLFIDILVKEGLFKALLNGLTLNDYNSVKLCLSSIYELLQGYEDLSRRELRRMEIEEKIKKIKYKEEMNIKILLKNILNFFI